MGTEKNVNSSESVTRLSYRQAGLVKDYSAWRAVLVVAGVTGDHLPIVGVGFNGERYAG